MIQKVDMRAMPVMDLAVSSRLQPVRAAPPGRGRDQAAPSSAWTGWHRPTCVGGLEREIRVAVDRDRLQAYGFSLDQLVADAVGAESQRPRRPHHRDRPSASWCACPAQFTSVEAMRNAPLPTPATAPVRLADVAEVLDTHKERETIARLDGRDADWSITVPEAPRGQHRADRGGRAPRRSSELNRTLPAQTPAHRGAGPLAVRQGRVADVTNNLHPGRPAGGDRGVPLPAAASAARSWRSSRCRCR